MSKTELVKERTRTQLQRLKWGMMFAPLVLLTPYEAYNLLVVKIKWQETLLDALVVMVGSFALMQVSFSIIFRLYDRIMQQRARLAALHQVDAQLSASLDPKRVLETVLEGALRLAPAQGARILIYNPIQEVFTDGWERLASGECHPIDYRPRPDGFNARVMQACEPLVIEDTAAHPPLFSTEDLGRGVKATAGVPLLRGDQVLGVLSVGFTAPHTFTEDELEILRLLGNRAAVTLDNAHQYQRAEAAETRFRDVALSSADWIWEVDDAGHYTYCSESVVDVLGYTTEEILGQTPVELMPPDEAARVGAVFAEIAANQQPIVDLENRCLTRDGREVVLLTNGVPILDSEGNLLGYRGVDKDITERKRAEERERKIAELDRLHSEISDAFLKKPWESARAASLMLEKTGEFMDTSRARVFHYSEDREYIDMMYEWRAEGIPQVNAEWPRIPAEAFSYWNKRLVTSQLINVSDIETLPKSEREFLRRRGIKSVLSVPIFVEDRLFGFINLEETRRYREWHAEEILFMQATANTYASAVEHQRTDDRLREAEQRLKAKLDYLMSPAKKIGDFKLTDIIDIEILQQIQDAFAQANGMASVIEDPDGNPITAESNYCQVCNLIRRTVKGRRSCRDSGIMLSNQVGETLKPALHSCQSLGFLEACVPIIVGGKCVANWFIGQCNTMDVTCKGIEDYGREIGADVDAMLKAFDKMPQMRLEKFEQVLSLLWQIAQELSAFAYNNLKLAKEITERKRAEEKLREAKDRLEKQNTRLEALYRVGQMVNSTLEPDAILDRLTDEAVRITRATHGQVLVVREESGCFERRSLRGFSPEEVELARTVPLALDRGINGRAYTTRQAVCVDDVQPDPAYFSLIPTTRTELAVPIIREEEVLGNLDLQSPEVGAFRDVDLDYLNALTDQAAIAIQNAHLFQAEHEQRELAEALEAAAAAVSSTLHLDQVLDRILEQVERVVPGDAFSIELVEDSATRMVRWRGYKHVDRESLDTAIPIADYPNLVKMSQSGKPAIVPDTATDPDWVLWEGWEWVRSYVGAPIQVAGETVAFLNVDGARPGQFGPADARRLQALAKHAAMAIENARLYKETQRELTERKRAEKQLQHYAAELEQTNEEVKQFAYIVSHDLRAPLVNLKGFAAELRAALAVVGSAMSATLPHLDENRQPAVITAIQEDIPEALGFIDSSVTRMDRFINAVLKLSRLGRRELYLEPVDVNTLVQATLQTLAHQIKEREVSVTVGSLPEIVADQTSMEQVMSNLLNNAIIYLDPVRPGEIEVIAERGDDEITFRVRDNGRGIAEDDMDKVFAPFRRAGRQDIPGEGMGLPYVQALVRRHGGRIWVESEPGKGSTFYFTIPADVKRKT